MGLSVVAFSETPAGSLQFDLIVRVDMNASWLIHVCIGALFAAMWCLCQQCRLSCHAESDTCHVAGSPVVQFSRSPVFFFFFILDVSVVTGRKKKKVFSVGVSATDDDFYVDPKFEAWGSRLLHPVSASGIFQPTCLRGAGSFFHL